MPLSCSRNHRNKRVIGCDCKQTSHDVSSESDAVPLIQFSFGSDAQGGKPFFELGLRGDVEQTAFRAQIAGRRVLHPGSGRVGGHSRPQHPSEGAPLDGPPERSAIGYSWLLYRWRRSRIPVTKASSLNGSSGQKLWGQGPASGMTRRETRIPLLSPAALPAISNSATA